MAELILYAIPAFVLLLVFELLSLNVAINAVWKLVVFIYAGHKTMSDLVIVPPVLGTTTRKRYGVPGARPSTVARTYVFSLIALRGRCRLRRFDPVPLCEQVLDVSGDVGLLAVSYSR